MFYWNSLAFSMIQAVDCVDHNKLWKILKEMEIPDHLTCLLRNLFAGQEATGIVNEAEVNVFLELSCFFFDPKNVGN